MTTIVKKPITAKFPSSQKRGRPKGIPNPNAGRPKGIPNPNAGRKPGVITDAMKNAGRKRSIIPQETVELVKKLRSEGKSKFEISMQTTP